MIQTIFQKVENNLPVSSTTECSCCSIVTDMEDDTKADYVSSHDGEKDADDTIDADEDGG